MQILDQKEKNYYYAPGIATYGIDGKPGKSGEDGSGIFFTTYLFDTDQNDLKTILSALVNSKSLIETTKEITLSRNYKDGDYIITKTGKIYQLNNFSLIDLSKFEQSVYLNDDEYKNYFNLVGVIDLSPQQEVEISSEDDTFTQTPFMLNDDGRITFKNVNTENNIKGLDLSNEIISFSSSENENSILRIINSKSSDGIYEMLSFSVRPNVDGADEESNLKIYYDGNTQSWCLSSNYQIVLDAPSVLVRGNNNSTASSNYSKVLTYDDASMNLFSLESLYNSSKTEFTKKSNKLVLSMNDIDNSIMNTFTQNLVENSYFKIEIYTVDPTTHAMVPTVYFYKLEDCKFSVNSSNKTNIICETGITITAGQEVYAYLVVNSEILIHKENF